MVATSLGFQLGSRYEDFDYDGGAANDPAARLNEALHEGRVRLGFDESRGYLKGVLDALEIPVDSQLLVFSKTSFQIGLISASTPRAIYFNEHSYVAWEQGSRSVEIASIDPVSGPRFYSMKQDADAPASLTHQTGLCLRCHDSMSLGADGYPRMLMGSGITDATGRLVSHEGWKMTTPSTPLAERWGGWFITGRHGNTSHGGNRIARLADGGTRWELPAGDNLQSLDGLLDVTPYLSPHSDIVAALILEHQVHVQNALTRFRWFDTEESLGELVNALSLEDEASFDAAIQGTSSFSRTFQARGPRDSKGRSLRELDLETRLFRFPLSYLVYSDFFRSLPEGPKARVVLALRERLRSRGEPGRQALEIWSETEEMLSESEPPGLVPP